MRRLLAITMSLLFGVALAAPLFASASLSDVPECCRRTGRHHCMAAMMGDSERSFSSIAPKCPNCPKATVAPCSQIFGPAVSSDEGTLLFTHPASAPQTEARYRIAYARSRQKRGPPLVIAS